MTQTIATAHLNHKAWIQLLASLVVKWIRSSIGMNTELMKSGNDIPELMKSGNDIPELQWLNW